MDPHGAPFRGLSLLVERRRVTSLTHDTWSSREQD